MRWVWYSVLMQATSRKIFKSYDIRGIYPADINEETAYEIGRALGNMVSRETVIVGRDMREGSPALHRGLIRGLTEEGVNVEDIGLVSIDGLYFAAGKYGRDAFMITASHNPREYAGIKMLGKGTEWIRGTDVLNFIEAHPNLPPKEKRGSVTEKDITAEHIAHILSFIDVSKLKPMKIVIDAGNGMAGKVIPELFKNLPFEIVPLCFELDGAFPNHPSNPLEPASQVGVIKKVVEERADLGIIFDGDADRMFFVDETGRFIRADYTLLALAKMMLEKHPGAGIAYSVECSKIVPEKIRAWGGRPIRTPVGYVNVSVFMQRESGVMGGEFSAHYSFSGNYYCDSGFIALLLMLELISESGKKVSELVGEFEVYAKADQINLEVHNISEVLGKIKERYRDAEMDELDGVTIRYPDWWCVIRASNTEPLLRINIEGDTKEIMDAKVREMDELVRSVAR